MISMNTKNHRLYLIQCSFAFVISLITIKVSPNITEDHNRIILC